MANGKIAKLLTGEEFCWAVGIEDTFIVDPWPKTGRILDEYELTGHYRHWREDLELMHSLGVRWARYGIPWYRINAERDRWDWSWSEASLSRLLELGIEPIVDLVHYGVPGWIESAYLNPDFPQHMADYAARAARLCGGALSWFTPLNEPRITAWYCGKIGWWPPRRHGWRGFVSVMLSLCKGMLLSAQAIRSVRGSDAVMVHVDACDRYSTEDPSLLGEVAFRQHVGFLALDLVSGRVGPTHPLTQWLLRNGATEAELDWFAGNGQPPDISGMNFYPMFSDKWAVRTSSGMRLRMRYGDEQLATDLLRLYHRHSGLPVMVTETAARKERRPDWLRQSLAAVRQVRSEGVPCVGYTWWPMYALVAWAYRQNDRPLEEYLEQMGLWDLQPAANEEMTRVPTEMVPAFRRAVAAGTREVGELAV